MLANYVNSTIINTSIDFVKVILMAHLLRAYVKKLRYRDTKMEAKVIKLGSERFTLLGTNVAQFSALE